MASENIRKEVIISLQLDTSDLEKKSAGATAELAKLGSEKKSLDALLKQATFENNAKDIEKYSLAIVKNNQEIKKQKSIQAEVNKELENNAKIVNSNVGSNNQLRALLSKLTAQLNAMGESEVQTSEKGKQLAKTVREISDQLKENESAVGDNRRNVGNYTKIELAELIEALKKENQGLEQVQQTTQSNIRKGMGFNKLTDDGSVIIGNFTNSLNAENKALMTNEEAYESATSAIHSNNEEIANLERRLIGFTQNEEDAADGAKEYANNLDGLKSKLSDLQQTLSTQEIGSKAFEQTQKAIKDTEFQINKVQGKVDEFGNKEPKNLVKKSYEDLGDATAGVIGGIQLMEIAFGKSNSTAAAQARVLQLIAIQQGIVNVAKSVGAIQDLKKVAIDKIMTLQLKNFTAASIAQAQATNTMSLAQRIYTAVVGKSTGAMKVFKLALAGTGIGALVILLSELIFNFEGVNKILDKVINSVDDFFTRISGGSKILKAVFTALAVVLLGPIAPLILLVKLISDFEGTTKRMQQALIGVLNEVVSLTDGIPILGDVIKFLVANVQATIKVFNDLAKSLGLIGKPKIKTDIEGIEKVMSAVADEAERANRSIQRQIDLLKAQGKNAQEIAKLERRILENNNARAVNNLEIAKKQLERYAKNKQKLNDDEQKKLNELIDAEKEAKNALRIFDANNLKERQEANKEAAENKKEAVDKEKDLLQSLYDFENQIIKDSKDLQIESIKDQEKRELESLDESVKNNKIKLQADLDAIIANTKEEKRVKELVQKDLNARLIDIDLQHAKDRFDITEKFRIEAAEKVLAREMIVAEKSAAIQRQMIEETEKNEKEKAIKLIGVEIDLQNELLRIVEANANLNKFITPEEEDSIDAAKLKLRQLEHQLKEINETPLQIIPDDFAKQFEEVVKIITDVMNSFNDAVNSTFANQQAKLELITKAQIKGIEQSTLTEKQKAKQIEKINLEAAKKKYQLEVEAFNFNKGFQIAMAVINTAASIVNAFATAPFPVSIVQAAVAAATGAVQIGIIASQQPPPPPFYEGGYTGEGDPRSESRVLGKKSYQYHHDEYVVPSKVLRSRHGSALVDRLEQMRMNKIGSLGMTGFADGGFASSQIRNNVASSLDMEILSNKLLSGIENIQNVVLVSDINRVNNNVKRAKVKSSL